MPLIAPAASSPEVRRVMQGNRSSNTRPERRLRSAVHRRGLRFRKHHRPLESIRCRADLVFPRERVAVFVDGCFWHRCPDHGVRPATNRGYWDAKIARNLERDARNNDALAAGGWTVLRVWEHEDPDEAADRVMRVVLESRGPPRPAFTTEDDLPGL